MPGVFKISEAASLAMHGISFLAFEPDKVHSARKVGSRLKVSVAHLSKVLRRLSKAGLVTATRGAAGGFKLAKPPDKITLLDVFEAIEGPLEAVPCMPGCPLCSDENGVLGKLVQETNDRVRKCLGNTRLSKIRRMITPDHLNDS